MLCSSKNEKQDIIIITYKTSMIERMTISWILQVSLFKIGLQVFFPLFQTPVPQTLALQTIFEPPKLDSPFPFIASLRDKVRQVFPVTWRRWNVATLERWDVATLQHRDFRLISVLVLSRTPARLRFQHFLVFLL